MISMKQRIFRIVALILAVILLIGAIPISAILISKFTKDKVKDSEPLSLSVSNNMDLIERSNALANGVNLSYSQDRSDVVIENQDMTLFYNASGEDYRQVDSIQNTSGSYITDTMDMYVRTKSGATYYSSRAQEHIKMNCFKYGYYYYDVRLEGHGFVDFEAMIDDEDSYLTSLDISKIKTNDMTKVEDKDNCYKVASETDPYLYIRDINFDANEYQYVKLTMKANKDDDGATLLGDVSSQMFIIAGDFDSFNAIQSDKFSIKADGDEHTYYLALHSFVGYHDRLKGVRFDFSLLTGYEVEITEISLVSSGMKDIAHIKMSRNFHVYSNKLNHVAQVLATSDTYNIDAIGMETKIKASTVSKITIKDTLTNHSTLADVDWPTVEYIGFDIKDVGIFGYIMVKDSTSGSVRVELKDGYYIIKQERAPTNNMLCQVVTEAVDENTIGNARDFYIGQRIYTDSTHSFQGLMAEGYNETHPLESKHIKIDTQNSTNGEYLGYDALRGAYIFKLHSLGFSDTYYNYPNRHCNILFSIIGDTVDRNIYMVATTTSGGLETAALLDSSNMMLPVPLEVCKAFGSDGDINIYSCIDRSYGETIFPMRVKAYETNTLNLINMYQNWGNYPLKQLSSIQYFLPYYHLSTGVTETNCISNYLLARLPDHRAMSGSMWYKQPQHNSAGTHEFLQYSDANNQTTFEQYQKSVISSYGPTYSDLSMTYQTTDGRVKITYDYIEMPQTDENRSYYTMTYEILEDIEFNDFINQFSFYSITSNDPKGEYTKIGFLNNANTYSTESPSETAVSYELGNNCPYVSFYDMDGCASEQSGDVDPNTGEPINRYCNLSFLIKDYSIKIGNGTPNELTDSDVGFAIVTKADTIYLTLNLSEVTFKKGDSITMDAIIMPWGSEEMDEVDANTGKNYYDKNSDQPVRDVRESILQNNRLKITADKDCEVIEHSFLPIVETSNGMSAEFSITNGVNNIAVRANGFNNLNRPTVYEFVDGGWTVYELSSINSPDKAKITHDYDGYAVYYDGQSKTYSYSFIVPMQRGQTRKFKIVVEDRNAKNINMYLSPLDIKQQINVDSNITKSEILNENNQTFIRLYSQNSQQTYLTAYKGEDIATGKYLTIKYRASNNTKSSFQINASTSSDSVLNQGDMFKINIIQDGEWHTVIVDIERAINTILSTSDNEYTNQYAPNEQGKYIAKYLRVNIADKVVASNYYVDIAHIGLCDDMAKANLLLNN